MGNYEEKILITLAEKYRRSKKDSGTNVTARRTRVLPRELYKKYNQNDGDLEQIGALNQAALRCRELGFVTYEMQGFSSEIQAIYLVDEQIGAVEAYLTERYQYESKSAKIKYIEGILAKYGGKSPAAERECEKLRQALAKNRIPAKYLQTEELLQALVFIEQNEKELFLREASVLIYGDSKYLEENMLSLICRTLRDFRNQPCEEGELEDGILEAYHIIREKRRICLKGNVEVTMAGRTLDAGACSDGIEFFAWDLEQIGRILVKAGSFMTVENYTSWMRMKKKDTVFFYLGGYADRVQRTFLKMVFRDNPQLTYFHFGDMDAGGLYIHEHLCRVTGIPFQMYRMSEQELTDPRFAACLHPLTQTDRIRLESLEKQDAYRELAAYMLQQNVKLEQEIISYMEQDSREGKRRGGK